LIQGASVTGPKPELSTAMLGRASLAPPDAGAGFLFRTIGGIWVGGPSAAGGAAFGALGSVERIG